MRLMLEVVADLPVDPNDHCRPTPARRPDSRYGRRDARSLTKAGISWLAGGQQHCDEFARVPADAQTSMLRAPLEPHLKESQATQRCIPASPALRLLDAYLAGGSANRLHWLTLYEDFQGVRVT